MRDLFNYLTSHIAVRYVISGGSAAVVNLVTFALLEHFAPIPVILSSVCASCIAFWTSFLLQKFFTFKDTAPIHLRQLIAFLGAFLWNLTLITLLFWLFLKVLPFAILAQFCAIAIAATMSFFIYRVIFRDRNGNPTQFQK